MVASDFRQEVEIWPFRACAMHPDYWNSSFTVDLAMGQIPRSTERISSCPCSFLFENPYCDIFPFCKDRCYQRRSSTFVFVYQSKQPTFPSCITLSLESASSELRYRLDDPSLSLCKLCNLILHTHFTISFIATFDHPSLPLSSTSGSKLITSINHSYTHQSQLSFYPQD